MEKIRSAEDEHFSRRWMDYKSDATISLGNLAGKSNLKKPGLSGNQGFKGKINLKFALENGVEKGIKAAKELYDDRVVFELIQV